MTIENLIFFFFTELALCISPGPAVFYVLQQSMAKGYRGNILSSMGITIGNSIYFFLSSIGLSSIIVASESLYFMIKVIGGGYLFYLGGKHLLQKDCSSTSNLKLDSKTFISGVFLQLSNPKNIIIFVTILPAFINPSESIAPQFILLGLISITLEFCVLFAYGKLARFAANNHRFKILINYLSVLVYFIIGFSMIFIN